MISSGGGPGGLPTIDDPIKAVISLVIIGALIWIGVRWFNS